MKRYIGPAAVLAAGLALQPAIGLAAWVSSTTGSGQASATQVNTATAPTVTRAGSSASISWSQGKLAQGTVATGYQVRRTVGSTTTTVCTTAEPTRSCTDANPASGTASYAIVNLYRTWSSAPGATTSFTFDQTAPTTSLSSAPAPNAAGWNSSTPTLTLTAVDAGGTGVAFITYKVGSASAVTVNAATATVPVSNPGTTVVTYFATDAVGNVEATKSYTVKFDATKPTATLASNPAPNAAGWNASAASISLTASDTGGSGVASITYKVGTAAAVTVNASTASFTVSSQGSTTITYYARDVAGNIEATNTYTVRLDTTAPTTSITFPADNGSYKKKDFDDGCNTSIDDVCGVVDDNLAVDKVIVGVYSYSRDACLYNPPNGWGECFDAAGKPNPNLPVATITGTTWSYETGTLAKGSYLLGIQAYDKAGNASAIVYASFDMK